MELFAIVSLVLVGLLWHTSMRAREKCHQVARDLCTQMGVGLLDDTVMFTYLGLRRNAMGRVVLRRIYEFNFLDESSVIHRGTIILSGLELESCLVDLLERPH